MGIGFLKQDSSFSERLKEYMDELQGIEIDIRKISHNLTNNISDSSDSFKYIINQLIKNKNDISKISFKHHFDEGFDFDQLSNDKKINIYRLIQESLQNTIKHSEATSAEVRLFSDNNFILLSLKDNGKGFDLNSKKDGIGFKNMKNRISSLKGHFEIETSPKGTICTFRIPINDNGKF